MKTFYVILPGLIITSLFSSFAIAGPLGTFKRDFASILNIKSACAIPQANNSEEQKSPEANRLPALGKTLNQGLDAFLDFGSSAGQQGLGEKSSTKDFRTTLGFHIPLQ